MVLSPAAVRCAHDRGGGVGRIGACRGGPQPNGEACKTFTDCPVYKRDSTPLGRRVKITARGADRARGARRRRARPCGRARNGGYSSCQGSPILMGTWGSLVVQGARVTIHGIMLRYVTLQ